MTNEIGKVYDGYYALDGTHPTSGNFVLMPNGEALYGGASYYRHGYAPQSAVKPEPVAEPEYVYRAGDRVRVIDNTAYPNKAPAGSVGTVVEDATADKFFGVTIDHNGREWMFAAKEVEAYTEPTHRHPEGLYEGPTQIIVRHEQESETYSFLYVANALDGKADPVNRGMSGSTLDLLGYTLVTEFKA